jgi:membrane fusion protein, multidrug efflux system
MHRTSLFVGATLAAIVVAAAIWGFGSAPLIAAASAIFEVASGAWHAGSTSTSGAAARGGLPIPVIVTTAARRDVSDYLTGLGTVQAFNRVTVHVRVDGELQSINFVEGQFVHAGDVLATIDPRPLRAALDQARAKKSQDDASQIALEKDLQRFTSLAVKSFESQQNVDLQQAKVDQGKAQIEADAAALEYAEVQLGYTTVVSPITGRTGIRLIDKGNIVHANDAGGLVIITQVQPIAVVFSLPQDHLAAIAAAMKNGALKVSAYSRDNATKLAEGKLMLIDNQIDVATGTLRLKASFDNNDDALWPGEFVNARLELTMRNDVVAIPSQVLQRGPDSLYVYVVRPDQTAERRPVKVGPARDGLAVIEQGLSAGERVVVDGQFKLRPGAKVSVTMMPSEKTAAEKTAQREN